MKYTKAFLLTALIFVCQRSEAVDYGFFGNLAPGEALSATNNGTVGGASDVMYAQGFTMGSSYAYTFNQFRLGVGGVANSGTPQVMIYSDNAGAPGTALSQNLWNGTAAPVSPVSVFMPFTYNSVPAVSLSANTKYWLVVSEVASGSGGASFGWYDADPGIVPNDSLSSPTSGVTYFGTKTKTSSTGWVNSSDTYLGFRLAGTAIPVPEPSTYALGAIASCVLAYAARRRKAKATA